MSVIEPGEDWLHEVDILDHEHRYICNLYMKELTVKQ